MSARITVAALVPVLAATLAACTPAPDLTPLETTGSAIVAAEVWDEPPLDPDHQNWKAATPVEVTVYPQTSVPPAARETTVGTVQVRALHNGEALALRLAWKDPAPAKKRGIRRFADAAAIQWPLRQGPGSALPYIGMGQPDDPVAVWLWRASGEAEALAAEGFGTLTAQPDDGLQARGSWADGTWRVVLRRRLAGEGEHSVALGVNHRGLFPLALAVWNGEASERNGMKRLSGWRVLYLEGRGASPESIDRLAERPANGDPERGRRLMREKGCVACHAYPDNPARPDIGPDLTYAGGIHRADYLRQSIAEPSAVVVPGEGYATVRDGAPASLMPPLQGSEQELEDLVAYLQSPAPVIGIRPRLTAGERASEH